MPKQVQLRRGTTAQTALFRGAQGEVTVDTDRKALVVHDGSTFGGFPQARADQVPALASNFADLVDKSVCRSNLYVFSKDDASSGQKCRAFGPSVAFDGYTSTQRLTSALNLYSISTNEFSVRSVFRFPAAGTARTLFFIGSSASAPAANSFSAHVTLGGEVEVRLYGASASDYTYTVTSGLSAFAGKVVELHVVRAFSGVLVYVNGALVATTAPAGFGTGPGFAASVTSTYLTFGSGIASTSTFVGELYALSLLNFALSASQSFDLSVAGFSYPDQWANQVYEVISAAADRNFSAPSNWANTSMTSYDESGDLSLVANAAGQVAYLAAGAFVGFLTGTRYLIQCDVANLVGTFGLYSSATGALLGTISANGKFSCTFIAPATSIGDLQIKSVASSASGDFDNFSVRWVGGVLDLDFGGASHYFIPDGSSNSLDALMPEILRAGRNAFSPAWVRGSTNTNGNQKLLGAPCLFVLSRISRIEIWNDNDGTAVTSVDLGTASGLADVAAAVPIGVGVNSVTLASRYLTGGELWVKSNGTSRLHLVVFFDYVPSGN
jgi:hypothetical protein